MCCPPVCSRHVFHLVLLPTSFFGTCVCSLTSGLCADCLAQFGSDSRAHMQEHLITNTLLGYVGQTSGTSALYNVNLTKRALLVSRKICTYVYLVTALFNKRHCGASFGYFISILFLCAYTYFILKTWYYTAETKNVKKNKNKNWIPIISHDH